jgi:hypothetical protein
MNSTNIIGEGVSAIASAPVPLWIKFLAFFGAIYLFNVVFKTGINLVYFGAYIIGLVKWIYDIICNKAKEELK